MKHLRVYLGCIATGLFATGCALHEARQAPPTMPSAFAAPPVSADASLPEKNWYDDFGSPELQALIGQAAANNLDLGMARARVTQADARARQAGAAILPSIDAAGNGNYLAGHSANGNAHETDWAALLSASYEVDFWGKNRATARAASRLADASRADRDTVALATLAGVADSYFKILSLRDRLELATLNLNTAQKLLDVVQARFDAGVANPVELAAQKAALAAAGLAVPELRQQEAEALAALALLLGRAPEQFSVESQSLESLLEPKIGSGLPSGLFPPRADVVIAEGNMPAANADLLAARAALFPSLTLNVSGGVQNPALNAAVLTLSGAGPTLNLGASLTQSIFDSGRLREERAEEQDKDAELEAA